MESPVWMPIGSMFSMAQMMTTLSFLSRSSSSSYSFQPIKALSIMTSWIGDASSPRLSISSKSSGLWIIPAPAPPSVKEALMTKGKPNSCAISFPFRKEVAAAWGGMPTPIFFIKSRNLSRFSVMWMASISTPTTSISKSAQTPFSPASIQRFRAVCPPIVGSTASILGCFFKISTMDCVVSGLRYTWSAMEGSVIMVAGLLLMRMVSIPSSRRDRRAWEPE